MSKQAKEAPPVAGTDFESPDFDPPEVHQAELIQECVATILSRFEQHVVALHERNRATLESLEFALGAAMATVDMLHITREELPVSGTAACAGSWEVEQPPQTCGADTWLRAAIPEAALPPKAGYMLNQFLAQDPGSSRPHSKGSVRSMASSTPRSGGPMSPSQRLPSPSKSGLNTTAARPTSAQARAGTKAPSTLTGPAKVLTAEERQAEERLREELKIRKAQQQAASGLQAKDEEEKAELETLRRTLKGRDYAYDHRGKAVILDEADGDRLDEALPAPSYTLAVPDDPEQLSPPRKGGARPAAGGAQASKSTSPAARKAAAEKAQERKLLSDFHEVPSRAQPSPMDIMHPVRGVTLRDGGRQRIGPQKPKSAVNLSGAGPGVTREEYAKMVVQHQQQASRTRVAPPATANGSLAGTPVAAIGSLSAPLDASRPSCSSQLPAVAAVASSALQAGAASEAVVPPAGAAGASDARPISRLAASSLQPSAATAAAAADGARGTTPVLLEGLALQLAGLPRKSAPPPAVEQDPVDPVFELMKSGEWGTDTGGRGAPAPIALLPESKPTLREIDMEVGRHARLPRERANMATMIPPLAPGAYNQLESTLGRKTMINYDG